MLARVAHRAYPDSVCGVVYQGAHRRTGCQFTFTCDGALARPPRADLWDEAADVARRALAGELGGGAEATHYHADYVRPYWASSLTEVARIGRHVFYALGGRRSAPLATVSATAAPGPRATTFSPWGLPVATLSPTRGGVAVTPAGG